MKSLNIIKFFEKYITYKRYMFRMRRQNEGEIVDEFVTELK